MNTEQYFSTVPEIQAPRSVFDRSFSMKTTMNTDYLYPIFIDEALPGDSMKMDFQVFGRIVNPLVVPIMDELYFETLWFKCDNRLLWNNWPKFCGEQDNPGDSTDYVIPTVNTGSVSGGTFSERLPYNCVDSVLDHFGIPPYISNMSVNSLPFRFYNRVYNEWFRDTMLINSATVPLGDTDNLTNYPLRKSAKIHDYFTSCLPTAQLGNPVNVAWSINQEFPVYGNGKAIGLTDGSTNYSLGKSGSDSALYTKTYSDTSLPTTGTNSGPASNSLVGLSTDGTKSGLVGKLSTGDTAISVNDIRFAFKLQQFREINSRYGANRYITWIKAHFNVDSPDARYHRTQFLGSTREMIDINTVVQTSSTDSTSPQGNLAAFGVVSHHGSGFSTSFTEHGYLMGIARIRHNPIYQQGVHKMWKRSTLLDFYLPIFNGISEQPVYNYEIYAQGNTVPGLNDAFGFQEAWAEYRYKPSMITGLLRSKLPNQDQTAIADLLPLDIYHLGEVFSTRPVLNQSFIEESVDLNRALSVQPSEEHPENTPQFIFDFRFNYVCARPMPVRNIPDGLGSGARF